MSGQYKEKKLRGRTVRVKNRTTGKVKPGCFSMIAVVIIIIWWLV